MKPGSQSKYLCLLIDIFPHFPRQQVRIKKILIRISMGPGSYARVTRQI